MGPVQKNQSISATMGLGFLGVDKHLVEYPALPCTACKHSRVIVALLACRPIRRSTKGITTL
jgi:hypothetical protein